MAAVTTFTQAKKLTRVYNLRFLLSRRADGPYHSCGPVIGNTRVRRIPRHANGGLLGAVVDTGNEEQSYYQGGSHCLYM